MKILIMDGVHEVLMDGLEAVGHEVTYLPDLTREDLIGCIGEFDGLVVRTKTSIDRDVLLHAAKLKFVGRAGAGVDNIDTEYCEAHGIAYFNAGEANADAVGEQAIGMLLSLFAKIQKADKEVRSGIWDREGNRGIELSGKTVAIIGYGNTGKAFSRKLKGFGVKVMAYDKYLTDYGDDDAGEATMEEIFRDSDIISFHVPLTMETTGLVNSAYISSFRKDIYLLNLSRGKVVVLDDLVEQMKKNKVKGAGLDVLENENIGQLSDRQKKAMEYLVHSERTVLTPHIGGWTEESYKKISVVLLQKIKQLTL